MFHINDILIYGANGVCRIVDIQEKSIGGVKKNYFVLKPIYDSGSTIFAPTDNEAVLKKMRRLLTKEEIHELISSMPDDNGRWIESDNERREHYKKVLASAEPKELLKTIKAIYNHKKQREEEGKRLHTADEHFFKDAEQILYNEFQYVLQLSSKDELMAYILARIQKQ